MNNKNEKFMILTKFKEFSINIEPIIERIPKKDYISRSKFFGLVVDTIKLINMANYEDNIDIKKNYQVEVLSNINTIDFILERAYKLGYITEVMCNKAAKDIRSINAMVYRWYNNGKVS